MTVLKRFWLLRWKAYSIILGYSSQVRLVSSLWLQGHILVTSVIFSIAKYELRG